MIDHATRNPRESEEKIGAALSAIRRRGGHERRNWAGRVTDVRKVRGTKTRGELRDCATSDHALYYLHGSTGTPREESIRAIKEYRDLGRSATSVSRFRSTRSSEARASCRSRRAESLNSYPSRKHETVVVLREARHRVYRPFSRWRWAAA